MNRINTSRSWLQRSIWGAALLLLGLLLSSCVPAGPTGDNPEGERRGQEGISRDQAGPCDTGFTAIGDEAGLKAIANDPSGSYCLTNDIVLTKNWTPLGTFTGVLDGNSRTISGLIIDDQTGFVVGFFRELGEDATVKNLIFNTPRVGGKTKTGVLAGKSKAAINNLKIEGGTIQGWFGYTGGIVAVNNGTIEDSYAANLSVSGDILGKSGGVLGGLVGWNYGTVRGSHYAADEVSGDIVGGLVGWNDSNGIIENSYATSEISGSYYAGGLVGRNGGTIKNSHASGAVNGSTTGGLVGFNFIEGTITNSYATGDVEGSDAGGLVGVSSGLNFTSRGTIENSYATGNVNGNNAGGLVGVNGGSIENSYASGAVRGTTDVGGLVGENGSSGVITSSYYDKTSTGQGMGIGQDSNSNSQTVAEVSAAANIEKGAADKYYDNGGTPGDISKEIFIDWTPSPPDPAIWTFATGEWPTLKWQTTP